MEHSNIVSPLTLVEVIAVFDKAGGIDDSEIGRMRQRSLAGYRAGFQSVPGFRFAKIIKPGPHKLPGDIIPAYGILHRGLCRASPFDMLIAIGSDRQVLPVDPLCLVFPS